jgi:hypothetical protein
MGRNAYIVSISEYEKKLCSEVIGLAGIGGKLGLEGF